MIGDFFVKYIFIINPSSGSGNYQALIDALNIVRKNVDNFEYDLVLSEYKYHIYEIVKRYIEQEVCLVACGGDGTINEVLNSMNLDKHILATIPIGSANDFIKMRPFEMESLVEEIKHLLNTKPIAIDFGMANEIRFINSFGLGFDTRVMTIYDKYRDKFKNRDRAYSYSVFLALKNIQPTKIKVNGIEYRTFLMAINNGKYYGGSFKPTPDASLLDGLLDLCLIKKLNYFEILTLIPAYKKGNHTNIKKAVMVQAKSFSLESDLELLVSLDGELYKMKNINVRVVERGVKIIL